MKKLNRIIVTFIMLICGACDDVLEEDITGDIVKIVTPLDGAVLEGNIAQFRWDELEGAKEYRLQIMKNENFVITDTLVIDNVFNYQINSGKYLWRIRGENFGYNSIYTFDTSFTMVASLDLADQTISLKSPVDNLYYNGGSLNLSWEPVETAEFYQIELLKVEGEMETSIFVSENIAEFSFALPDNIITDDANYVWQVKAINTTSQSEFFRRNIFLDSQVPVKPVLTTPTEGQVFTVSTDINFSWSYQDEGQVQSAITSSLQVSTDENFTEIVQESDNSNLEFSTSFASANTYYWRVKGTDEALNKGEFSVTGTFTVN